VPYYHLDLVVALFVDFVFLLSYSFFYLGHFVILVFFVPLVTILFVISRYWIKDIFDVIIYHHYHTILFHYLPFTVVHHINSSA
jgi:hypothetical protein